MELSFKGTVEKAVLVLFERLDPSRLSTHPNTSALPLHISADTTNVLSRTAHLPCLLITHACQAAVPSL